MEQLPEIISGFSDFKVGAGEKWVAFNDSFLDAIVTAKDGVLCLDASSGFKQAVPYGPGGSLDHLKYLVYRNQNFTLPKSGEIRYEAKIFGRQYFGRPPYRSSPLQSDFRLCCGGISCFDPETMMAFDCVVTDHTIYAIYQRLPFRKTSGDSYGSFTCAVPIGDNSGWSRVAIHCSRTHVSWFLNGKEKLKVRNIGLPLEDHVACHHGGKMERVTPKQINCGFGLFTYLDMKLDQKMPLVRLSSLPYVRDEPLSFQDDGSEFPGKRLLGQGMMLKVKSFKVSLGANV